MELVAVHKALAISDTPDSIPSLGCASWRNDKPKWQAVDGHRYWLGWALRFGVKNYCTTVFYWGLKCLWVPRRDSSCCRIESSSRPLSYWWDIVVLHRHSKHSSKPTMRYLVLDSTAGWFACVTLKSEGCVIEYGVAHKRIWLLSPTVPSFGANGFGLRFLGIPSHSSDEVSSENLAGQEKSSVISCRLTSGP